jgi:molybdopterin synthase catalytic subunit
LRETPFTAAILAELAEALAVPADGAVVGFLGRTRSTPGTPAPGQEAEAARHVGRTVESLEYEAHESMALTTLATIADEIAARFAVDRLAIVHRTGDVPLGEASIAVVAAAPHRDAAFEAARYAIDETKARAPIWKAERFADGHVWIGHQARTGPEADA